MKLIISLVASLLFLTGCASLSTDKQGKLDRMAQKTIAELVEDNEGLDKELDKSLGYLVVQQQLVKIPMIGFGGGKGVVVDSETGERTYVKVRRFDAGWGGGIRKFNTLLVFSKEKPFNKAKKGTWIFQAGGEASAGTAGLEAGLPSVDTGHKVYALSKRGASATLTAYSIRLSPLKAASSDND